MGKTSVVRNICNKFRAGVLYCEVVEPKVFVRKFAKGNRNENSSISIFDVILSYFCTT